MLNALNRREMALFYGVDDGQDQIEYLSSLHFPASDDYSNIPGDDVVGAYRSEDVPYQPMEAIQSRAEADGVAGTIYYERASESYIVFENGAWTPADAGRVSDVLETKAYIDMPNQGYLNFLNPRNVFFGVRISL